jgi:hypothetical protein
MFGPSVRRREARDNREALKLTNTGEVLSKRGIRIVDDSYVHYRDASREIFGNEPERCRRANVPYPSSGVEFRLINNIGRVDWAKRDGELQRADRVF